MKKTLVFVFFIVSFKGFGQNVKTEWELEKKLIKEYQSIKIKYNVTDENMILPDEEVLDNPSDKMKEKSIKVNKYDGPLLKKIHTEYKGLQKFIYGEDDRKELENVVSIYGLGKDVIKTLASGVCAIVNKASLELNHNNKYTINGKALSQSSYCGKDKTFCTNIEFGSQKSIVLATGLILNNDRVITADHSFNDINFNEYFIITNYYSDLTEFESSNVYEIKEVIEKQKEDEDFDFKILKTTRTFPNSDTRLQINYKKNLKNYDNIFMMGFPSGIPMKITDNAIVFDIDDLLFYSNLDAFSGNSGSPVFNSKGEVEGILIGGANDYYVENDKCCKIQSFSEDIEYSHEKETILRLNIIEKNKNYYYGNK